MRWSDSITDSMDMNLSKFCEVVKGREAWYAAVQGVTESDMIWILNDNKHLQQLCLFSPLQQSYKFTCIEIQ